MLMLRKQNKKTRNEMLLGFSIGKGTIGLHSCKKIILFLLKKKFYLAF